MGCDVQTRTEKIEWYRARAADCENLAKTAPDERAKALLSDMAAKWEKLASLVEKKSELD
jgi:hypothetical protein